MNKEELFPLVNKHGEVTGSATRDECHSGSMLLHPVVHLHLVTEQGCIYLQKRSKNKDIQPGKWDTAVGGHVDFGETIQEAIEREAREELGIDISVLSLNAVKPYIFQSDREQELINTFIAIVPQNININPDAEEIETGRFWQLSEVDKTIGKGILTPNFEQEYLHIKQNLLNILPTAK